jgi:hypothetical protein
MSYTVTWNDGKVRVFEVADRAIAERMARAYPNLVTSFEKVSSPMVESFSQSELEPDNRMIDVKKEKTVRKRKA